MKALAAAVGVVALLSGCGGSTPQPAGSIKVLMNEFKFDPATISAPSGKVVFYLVNGGSVSHDFVIRDSANNRIKSSELVSAGDSVVFTVDTIPAGTYTIFCDQSGHEASGMKGTLTIS